LGSCCTLGVGIHPGYWFCCSLHGCSRLVAAVLAWAKSDQWPAIIRATLYGTMIVVALGSVWVYGAVALGYLRVKVGFMFLVVPLASWLVLGVAAIATRRRLNRQTGM
jgi:hypothetical protein